MNGWEMLALCIILTLAILLGSSTVYKFYATSEQQQWDSSYKNPRRVVP